MDNMQDLDPKIYTVLWICPLKVEADAAYAALDNQHRGRWAQSDSNGKHYAPTAGDMCGHNVIIMTIPPGTLYGTTTATSIATEVRMSFPSIRIGLLVGIAAGLPNFSCNPPIDIRLGDVLVALSFDEKPPVVAYDLGKETGNAELELLRHGQALHLSESVLRSMFGNIWRSDAKTNGSASLMYYYNSIKDKAVSPGCSWEYPGCHEDIYFDVDEDGIEHEVTRDSRPDAMRSQVWYGSLGSGNRVMKDRRKSNQLRDRHNLIGLEMEAAGILNDFRVGVIRGVSDYADKHKKATFRPYAAIMAAAYAKLVMAFLTPDKLTPTPQTMQTNAPGVAKRPYEEGPDSDSAMRTKRGRTEEPDAEFQSPSPNRSQRGPLVPDTIEGRRMRLLESLENPAMNGKTITKQSASTCQWLLKASEYDEWLNAEISKDNRDFLWIKGHPGTGKSTLMKFLSKTLKARRKKGNAVISFFFHARGVELAKSTVGMYRSLLKQLLHALPRLQGILDSFDMSQQSKETPDWNLADLKSLFKKAIAQLGDSSLIILIDALDECEESQIRDMVKFLLCVGQKAQNKGIVLRICFASRFYPNISINEQRGIDLDLTSHVGHGQDMKTYINNELEGTIQEPETLQTISDSLMEKAQGVFLWLQLVVPRVVRAFDHGRLEDVELLIQKTPGKLYEVFKQMIEREPKPSAELLLCLQWILFARQPLSPAQLRDAILSGSRTKTPESAWFYSIHNKKKEFREAIIDKFIIDSSKGLAETIESGGEKIVQFIHESVRNFLLESAYWAGCLKDYWPGFLQNFKGKSHNTLKQCCTRYIRLSAPRVDSCTVYDPKKDEMFRNDAMYKFPLLEYVVGNILHHADTAEGSGVDQEAFVCEAEGSGVDQEAFVCEAEGSGVDQEAFVCEAEGSGASQEASVHEADGTAVSQEASVHEADGTAVSQDLCVGEGFPRCEWIKLQRLLSIYDSRRHVSSARLLYILSEHNAANLINRHPCKSNGFEQGDERYCMPLLAAVFAESHQARGALMRAYANAIMDARRHKLHAICDKFLAGEKKRRPRLTISTLRRKSVLCNVFLAGDESLYNFAVASDLSLEDDGWEALESAAKAGNEDMFNLLLELGADSKKPHNKFALKFSGRTLLWAVKKLWHNGVVRLLRSHADIEYSEEDWLTPLLCAAKQGEPRMVGLLLQFRANSRARDRCYWTPLMWAARLGHQAAVEILLCARASLRHQTAAGEPYQNDNSSITALWCAICQWLHKPRQVLPSSAPQEMDSNSTFSHDDSLMHEIRRVVLINERADVSGPNYAGITPLLVAVFVGDEELARLLIDKGADINWRDQKGATLLMYASFLQPNERLWPRNLIGDIREPTHAMQEGFAKLLIDKKADVNASDADGKTVLMHAVLYGNQWDLQLLLRCDAKVNTSTADGETALTYAVRARNHEALDWLLHSQADTDATTQNRHKALSIARAAGNQEAARLIETYTPGTQYYRDFHHRRSIMLLPSRTKLGGTLN